MSYSSSLGYEHAPPAIFRMKFPTPPQRGGRRVRAGGPPVQARRPSPPPLLQRAGAWMSASAPASPPTVRQRGGVNTSASLPVTSRSFVQRGGANMAAFAPALAPAPRTSMQRGGMATSLPAYQPPRSVSYSPDANVSYSLPAQREELSPYTEADMSMLGLGLSLMVQPQALVPALRLPAPIKPTGSSAAKAISAEQFRLKAIKILLGSYYADLGRSRSVSMLSSAEDRRLMGRLAQNVSRALTTARAVPSVSSKTGDWTPASLAKLEEVYNSGGLPLLEPDFALVRKIKSASLRDRILRTMNNIKRDWGAMLASIRTRRPLPWDRSPMGPRVNLPRVDRSFSPGGGGSSSGGGGSSSGGGGSSSGGGGSPSGGGGSPSGNGGGSPPRTAPEDSADALLDYVDGGADILDDYLPGPDGSGTPQPGEGYETTESEEIEEVSPVKDHLKKYWPFWAIGGVAVAGVGGYFIFRE